MMGEKINTIVTFRWWKYFGKIKNRRWNQGKSSYLQLWWIFLIELERLIGVVKMFWAQKINGSNQPTRFENMINFWGGKRRCQNRIWKFKGNYGLWLEDHVGN